MKWKRDWGLTGRQTVAWIIMLGLACVIIALAFRFLSGGWRYLIIGFVFVFVFVQFFFSDKIVCKTMHVQIIDENDNPKLINIIKTLADTADLPMPKVGIIMHPAMSSIPNAFATGRGPHHAVVAVTPCLLDKLNDQELAGVLAHELSHIKNRDMLTMTVGSFAVMIAQVLLNNAFIIGLLGGMRDSENGGGIVVYIVFLIVAFLVYILGTIVTMAISRYREFAADRGSAYITENPDALISALTKISALCENAPAAKKKEVSGMNAFYITPAISGDSVMELFSTHPTLEKRIENLEKVKSEL
ncbi:MAG TPA: zinc metalloprotease HtpX [Methanocorpusculum sp.]|nr:zinc metalloprotease HtpX [Methanocorpusculum sp.]